MEKKICTQCNIEENFEDSYSKFTECKFCNKNRSLECYYENKDKKSKQRKFFY